MFKIRENDHGMMSSQQPPCHLWSLPRPPQLTGPLTPPVWRETGNSFENFTCHCLLLKLKWMTLQQTLSQLKWRSQQNALVRLKWMTKQRKLVRLKGRSYVRLNVILKAEVIVVFEGNGLVDLKRGEGQVYCWKISTHQLSETTSLPAASALQGRAKSAPSPKPQAKGERGARSAEPFLYI